VRQARPDAWIVYKPHPDVVAGLRQRGPGERAATFLQRGRDRRLAAPDAGRGDEVHVLTSLAGFEALLRHKPVACWGQPFYAGWGLTQDRHPHPRRTRRLALDELVAGALIRYPVYVNRRRPALHPEEALDELVRWRDRAPRRLPWWRRWLRPLIARPMTTHPLPRALPGRLRHAGDIHPLLALGQALRAHGHPVTVLANPAHAGAGAATWISTRADRHDAGAHDTLSHPKLWHPVDGLGVMWRYLLRPGLEPTYEALARLAAQDRCSWSPTRGHGSTAGAGGAWACRWSPSTPRPRCCAAPNTR
jgi:hypothetical protein